MSDEHAPAKVIAPCQVTMLTFGGKQVYTMQPGDFHYGFVLTQNEHYTIFQNGLNFYVLPTVALEPLGVVQSALHLPVTPTAVIEAYKNRLIPDGVYRAFDEMIGKNWNGAYASFKEVDVARLAAKYIAADRKAKRTKINEVYDQRWLDVEDHYRKAGWEVVYDSPAFNETGPAVFRFSKK